MSRLKENKRKKGDRLVNLRKINVHEKISRLLVLLQFNENLFAASQGLVSRHHLGSTLF